MIVLATAGHARIQLGHGSQVVSLMLLGITVSGAVLAPDEADALAAMLRTQAAHARDERLVEWQIAGEPLQLTRRQADFLGPRLDPELSLGLLAEDEPAP